MKLANAIKAAKAEAWKSSRPVVNIFVTDGFAIAIRNRHQVHGETGYLFQIRNFSTDGDIEGQSVLLIGKLDAVDEREETAEDLAIAA